MRVLALYTAKGGTGKSTEAVSPEASEVIGLAVELARKPVQPRR